jgi:hypothetical protein
MASEQLIDCPRCGLGKTYMGKQDCVLCCTLWDVQVDAMKWDFDRLQELSIELKALEDG